MLSQKLYKLIFWAGYATTLIIAILPIAGDLTKIRFGYGIFNIRLDHLLHLSAYFLICMYYLWGQHRGLILFRNYSLRYFVIVTVILATVTEFVQIFVPARAFNVLDWVANVSGIAVGVIVIKIVEGRSKIQD